MVGNGYGLVALPESVPMEHTNKRSVVIPVLAALAGLMVAGAVDYLTGEISVALLYLAPIAVATWYAGKRVGLVLTLCSGCVWFGIYVVTETHGSMVRTVVETVVANGTFLTVTLLFSRLKHTRDRMLETIRDLKHASGDLARSNQDLEQFAYVASHDVQEPLRVVMGHLDTIQKRLADSLDERDLPPFPGPN
jgi:K+-sensing histidine kinase KdpD